MVFNTAQIDRDGSTLVCVLEVGVWASYMWYHVSHCQAHCIHILLLLKTFMLPSGSRFSALCDDVKQEWCGFRRLSNLYPLFCYLSSTALKLPVLDVFNQCIHTAVYIQCIYIYNYIIYICLSDSQHIFKHAGVWSFIPKHGNPNIMAMWTQCKPMDWWPRPALGLTAAQ